jgi:endo-1,4-beta-xylanase
MSHVKWNRIATAALLVGTAACGGRALSPAADSITPLSPPVTAGGTTLRALAAARGRYVGAVTGASFAQTSANGTMLRATLAREFSMVWSGNYLKFNTLRRTPATYDFFWVDSMVAFALKNDMVVRGHTLVWHMALPAWVMAGNYSAVQADSLMKDHITTVMTRYRGKIGIWDVVNEAIGDDASVRTSSYWYQKLGQGYVDRAFQLAHAVDPSAKLFYNDYGIEERNAKSDAVYAMLKDMIARGVPVNGIGFQGHFAVGRLPRRAAMLANFARFAALGLTIQVTELDIRIPLPVSAGNLAQQATDFATVFSVCLETPACNAVELSNTFDAETWVPETFRGFGSPGILDESFQRKPSFTAVYRTLGGKG